MAWVGPDGPCPADVAIVGEGPAEEEVKRGKGFVGPSGRLLWPLLHQFANVYRGHCWVTNLSKEPLPNDGTGKMAAAEYTERQEALLAELSAVEPKYVLAVGTFAAKALIPDFTTMDVCHGVVFEVDNRLIVPTWHPAAALRDSDKLAFTAWDIEQFGLAMQGKATVWRKSHFPTNAIHGCPTLPFTDMSVDTEGLPADPWGLTWATDAGEVGYILRDDHDALAQFERLCGSHEVILHNALWDVDVLLSMGVVLGRYRDTMEKAYLCALEPRGLKESAYRHLGVRMRTYEEVTRPYHKAALIAVATALIDAGTVTITHSAKTGKLLKKPKVERSKEVKALVRAVASKNAVKSLTAKLPMVPATTIHMVPLDDAVSYATDDVRATLALDSILTRRVAQLDATRVEALDLAVWPIFGEMQSRGLLMDKGRITELLAEVRQLAAEAEADCVAAGLLKPTSSECVAKWLRTQGIRLVRKTKGKTRESTDERALQSVAHRHPIVGRVLDLRGHKKLETTFLEPLMDNRDSRLRPRWRLTTVKSGRAATSDPNIMAFPAREAVGLRVRGCFVAPPGMSMISGDLSQIEPRCAAILSGDEGLLNIYRQGRDLYDETAVSLFGLPDVKSVNKTLHRLPTKVVTLGVLYGMGPPKLFDQLVSMQCTVGGVPVYDLPACYRLIEDWFRVYPGVKALIDATEAEIRANGGIVRTELGRPRYLPAVYLQGQGWPEGKMHDEALRQGFNHKIQGMAQEELKRAMIRVNVVAKKYSLHWLMQIHDELVLEGETNAVYAAAPEIKAAMEAGSAQYPIPIVASIQIGPDWASLKG